jgi:peptide/nickel transport system ATP-binding protein
MEQLQKGEIVLEAKGLSRAFASRNEKGLFAKKRSVHAVEGVSLTLRAGEVLAVVGESGSGKSVLARMLARIVVPTSGELFLRGNSIDLKERRGTSYAGEVQLILQDPFAAINPVRRVRHSLERPLLLHQTPKNELLARSHEVLASVSLTPQEDYLERYPHELSGGQLQRINIARGLSVNPKVLLADEPISMLDVSVRLGVLNLLRELCDTKNLAMMYITHDIASARYIADETAVMYAGQVVERARGTDLIDQPVHPYTQLLISSVPNPESLEQRHTGTQGSTGVAGFNVNGCRFSPRCPQALPICTTNEPPEVDLGGGHFARCWLPATAEQKSAVALRPSTSSAKPQ